MSQCAEIIAYMKERGSITSREAMMELDCGRLASRINELRHKNGYRIDSIAEERVNSKGVKKRYTRYFLKAAFCINCGECQPYTIQTASSWFVLPDGSKRQYIEKRAICTGCGNEVYVADVNDWNCKARELAYETWRELKSKEDEND